MLSGFLFFLRREGRSNLFVEEVTPRRRVVGGNRGRALANYGTMWPTIAFDLGSNQEFGRRRPGISLSLGQEQLQSDLNSQIQDQGDRPEGDGRVARPEAERFADDHTNRQHLPGEHKDCNDKPC